MKSLHYRPSDDAFVIFDDDREVASTNASTMLRRQTIDEKAAAVGLRRFVNFAEWQIAAAGSVLWYGSAEEAMQKALRK